MGPPCYDSMAAPQFSSVLEVPPAASNDATQHFAARLAYETDPSDVHADLNKGIANFVVVDCRSPESFAKAHVPGAINLPYRKMTAESTASLRGKTVVTYCTSIHCNASTKGALRLAQLGIPVKEMLGGIRAWQAEGYAVEFGP